MSPVCKQAKLHSLRRSDPSASKTLPSAYPTPACNPQGSHGQLPSTSVQDNLSPCSLCNPQEGNGSYPAAWHCGNQCPPKLWRQNSLSLDRKLKKKKVKSTNDRSCSVGTTVVEMPDPPSCVTSSTPLPCCWDAAPEPDSACPIAHRGTLCKPRHCALPRHAG